MASQSLYRKWRSQTFDEMVGQELITQTLKNALLTNQLRHAYIFTGPRGTGKTTTARLLAKTVNCTNPRNGEPCNACEQCREITAGTSFNVIEIDAASNRGIDSIRELREKVMVPPTTGRYKIYILDEAHMLTTEAFNALLKTLEEPPDYAIFVMATTDVHKMLPTVLSRCQRFDFKRFTTRQIVGHLRHVAREEQIEIDQSALELLARSAAGGMRDALSLLDQAIAYSGETISLGHVQSMLGVADARAIWKLLTHIASLDSPALLYLIHELSEAGADLRQINNQLVDYWRALMLAKAGADVAAIMDLTQDELNEVNQLIPAFTLDELTECARLCAQNDLMQKNQGTPQLGLELATLECLELHRRVQQGLPLASSRPAAPASQPVSQPVNRPAPEVAARPAPAASTPPSQPASIPATPPPIRPAPIEQPATPPAPAEEETRPAAPSLSVEQVRRAWGDVKARAMQKGKVLGTYLWMCDIAGVELENGQSVIVVRAAKPAHLKLIKERMDEVVWALELEFGQPCRLRVITHEQDYHPPASTSTGAGTISAPAHRARESATTPEPPPEQPRVQTPASAPRPSLLTEKPEVYRPAEKPPLARPQEVRENKKVPMSKAELENKVRADPVVQEAIKLFGATISHIEPK